MLAQYIHKTIKPARALKWTVQNSSKRANVAKRRNDGKHNKQAGLNLLRRVENLLQSIGLQFMLRTL